MREFFSISPMFCNKGLTADLSQTDLCVKFCVYQHGVLSKLNKIGLISQTHLLLFYLMYYSGDMFRLSI